MPLTVRREKTMKRLVIAVLLGALAEPAAAGGIVENFETPAECKDTGDLKIEACLAAIGATCCSSRSLRAQSGAP